MTEAVQVALIAAVPAVLSAAALWRAQASAAQSKKNGEAITEVHISLNSRLTELVTAAHAQGRQEERDATSVTVPGVPASEVKS